MKTILLIFAASVALSHAEPDGKQLFTMNCSACHLLDQMVVGPSLAEMRTIYNGKPEAFVQWCVEPQQKRENVIEMPSMAHIGEEGLVAIYRHIMSVSDGVKIKDQKAGDPYKDSPVHTARPQIQRIFMPDASPASIAVALDDDVSLCWDAGICSLRYSWSGGFVDGFPYWRGSGKGFAKIIGEKFYVEADSPLPAAAGERRFLGYSVKDGFPVFHYRVGKATVSESYRPVADGVGFERTFAIRPQPGGPLALNFPEDQDVDYNSDKGTWDDTRLTLETADASEFTITISRK